jgi:hypothetical protein
VADLLPEVQEIHRRGGRRLIGWRLRLGSCLRRLLGDGACGARREEQGRDEKETRD